MTSFLQRTNRLLAASAVAVSIAVTPAIAAPAAPQEVEVMLPTGQTWRADISERVEVEYLQGGVVQTRTGHFSRVDRRYVVLQTVIAGSETAQVIFLSDIRKIRSAAKPEERESERPRRGRGQEATEGGDKPSERPDGSVFQEQGVFVLPMSGMVGINFRYQEIEEIGKHADQWGPGQIIVLIIDSGGGIVIEAEKISDAMIELKRRHRVVAWIREAISAAAYTALHCDEIYFMRLGTMGAMTMFAGDTAISGAELYAWLDRVSEIATRHGSRNPIPIRAMVYSRLTASYDKDPVTGRVTWYDNDQGEFVLVGPRDNLTLNASNALHSGISNGTADTPEELAKLLQLEKWNELSDHGRRIAERWNDTVERSQQEIRRLFSQYQIRGTGTGDQEVVLQSQMQVIRELMRWWDRAPNVCRYSVGLPPKEILERQLREMERTLADMRRRRR
jgi:hypothetical protein